MNKSDEQQRRQVIKRVKTSLYEANRTIDLMIKRYGDVINNLDGFTDEVKHQIKMALHDIDKLQ